MKPSVVLAVNYDSYYKKKVVNNIIENLKLNNSNLEFIQNVSSIKINRYNFTEFQIPFEIRWRNSTIDNYKFWRIYSGLRYSRVINSKYTFDDNSSNLEIDGLPVNKDQLGLTLNIGFNTWNISLYQSMDSFFVHDTNSDISDLKQFRLGIIFYLF